MSLFDVLMGRQQQLNSANNSLADVALSRAEELNSYKAKAVEDLAANKKSLVGEFSQGGFLDTAVATGASLVTQTGEGLASALEMHNTNNETDPIKAAETRLAAKKIRDSLNMDSLVGINPDTGERTSSLQRRTLGNATVIAAQGSAAALQGLVGLASIPTLGLAGKAAEEAGFRPKDGIAALEEYLTPEMRAVNKRVEAADGFTATASEMLDNPSSITSGIVKSVPSMLLGGAIGKALGLAGVGAGLAGSLGEGAIMAGSQAEGIREQTQDGRLSLKQALYAAGTGVMGAGVGVLGNRLASKLRVGDIDEALVSGALTKTPRGMTSSMLLSGGLEGGEELLQSSGETIAQNLALNKPFDENLGDAAAMGLLTGAPMGALAGTSTSAAATAKDEATKSVQRATAIQTNDVSAYLNPESSQRDPVEAMKVWTAHAELETTTPEVRKENLKQSDALLTSLEDSWTQAVTVSKILKATPEQRAGFEAQAVALKIEIASLDQADTVTIAAKTAELTAIEQGLAIEPSILARQRQVGEVARKTKELNDSMRIHERLGEVVRGKVDVEAVASDLVMARAPVDPQDQPAVQASQAAAERLINLSMVSNAYLDDSTAMSLAEDTQNGLSVPQRDYLRQFSAARVAQNALETTDSVSKTILDGDDKGNLGLKQYKLRIGNALDSQNKAQALHYIELLSKFSLGHAEKAKVGAATLAQAVKENRTLQMIPGSTPGSWVTVPKAKWIDDLVYMRSIGGLAVHPNSDKSKKTILVMPSESKAIDQALLAHASAYQLKFGALPPGIVLPTVAVPVAQAPSSVVTPVTSANTSVAPVQKTPVIEQVAPAAQTTGISLIKNNADALVAALKKSNPKILEQVTDLHAQDMDAGAVAKQLGIDKDMVREIRLGLGLPEQGKASGGTALPGTPADAQERQAFEDWRNKRSQEKMQGILNRQKNKVPAQTTAAPTSVASVVPAVESTTSPKTPAVSVASPKQAEGDARPDSDKEVIANSEQEKVVELKQDITDIQKEIDYAEAEISQDNEASSEQNQKVASQEPAGSAAALVGEEEAGTGTGSDVSTPTSGGVLSIFAQYVANPFAAISGVIPSVSDVFKTVNLVAQYFKQNGVNATNVTNRPLVAVKDFLTAWENKEVSVKDFLDIPKEEKVSDEQKAALSNLAKTIKSWFPAIQSNFKKFTGNMDFKMTDMMQYLYTEEGGLGVDENVKTAIGYSAYHWIVDKASSPMFLTPEQISEMHNQDKDAAITEDGVKKLQRMTSYEHTAIAELGKVAVQALGLKLKDDAPVDLLPRLESALGVHVLSLLENAGYLTKVALPASQVNSYFDEETSSEFSEFTTYNYVQLVVKEENKKTVHTDAVRAIKDANYGSSDVASKLFGIELAPRMPETKPSKFVQKTAKDSQQDIPKAQRKAVQDTMNTPHTVIPEMWAAAEKLGREVILKIAGAKDIDSGKYHKENRSSIDAQNRNLETQFDLMSELLNQTSNKEGLDQAFYVAQSVWKNFRAGFSNQGLNLQTSKIHRFMFGRPNWTVKIDFDNQELVNEFLVSVAMALGVKTDQQRNTKTLNLFMEKLSKEPKVLEAVRVLQEGLEQGNDAVFTTKNIELVQDVASNAEGMMSLQAMVAFAKYLQARQTNQTGFTTTMLVGADGKTNGPMLTLLALGAAEFDTLNRGGFYSTEEGQAKHFSEYFEGAGAMDLYQDLGMAVLTSAKTKLASAEEIQKLHSQKRSKFAFKLSTPEQFAAFQVLTKALDKDGKVTSAMRNLTKTPLTSFFFGSSLGSSVRGMENAFIEGYYTALEDLAQGKRTDGTTLKSFIEATNVLLAKSKGAPINPVLDIEQMLEMSLTKAQEKALRSSFNVIVGASVKTTMTEYFDTFIGRRDTLNKTIQAAYETYAAVYAEAYNKELADLMEAGKIAYRTVIKGKDQGKKVPLHGLTVAQEKVLRLRIANIVPVMHTAYSKKEDNLRAGVYMAKTEVDKSKSALYANTIYTQGGNIGAQSHTRIEVSPGVAGLPYSMHSLDSFIMHLALNSVAQSMNVHDEGANGVDKVGGKEGIAHALNKNTIEALLEYSPAQEAVVMLERLVTGMADRIAKGTSSPSVAKDMLTKWQEVINRNVPDEDMVAIEDVGMEMLRRSVRNAYEASYARLTHISEMGSVDQYTWEGGQFTVTPEIRQRAVFLRDQLDKSASPKFQEAIKALNKAAFAVTAEPAPIDESANVVAASVPVDPLPVGTVTPWGVVGKPRIESDAALVAMFERTPVMTAKEVLKALRDRLQSEGKPSGTTKFQFALIQKLYNILPDALKIKYITSANTLEDVLDAPASNSRGWYVNRGINQEIYVLSPEFVNSGLEVETLLHEMLHAALLYVTAQPTASTKELVAELESLRQAALAFAEKNGLAKRFAPALANLDEFMAWGMFNVEFQTKVLNKVTTLTTKTKNNVMVTGMKKFISLITGFLFKDASSREQELMSNGLSILIANVSGLFEQAANNQNKTLTGTTNLSMAAQINAFTTTEVHDALDEGKVSPAFNEHLKEILNTIVDKLHGPANAFKDAIAKGVASTPGDVFNEAISSGVAPFTSELQASGFLFNNQTFFVAEQVEATVKALLDSKDNKMAAVREELRKLEAEVRGKLKPQDFFEGDWFQATKDEREQATALHSYLFKNVNGDYLARFAALGLSHEGFNALLKTPTKLVPVTQKDRSIESNLTRLFSKMLNAINGKFITHTREGQPADDKLAALVRQLVEIENRNKNTLKSPLGGIMDFADNRAKAARQGGKDVLSSILDSGMFMKSKNKTMAAASSVVGIVANNEVRHLFQNAITLRNSVYKERLGVIASAIAEMNGPPKALLKLLREGKAHLEGARKQIITLTNQSVLESFQDGGKYLSAVQKKAVTAVLLRTGAHVLLDTFDMKQLNTLVTDQTALDKAISTEKAKLSGLGNNIDQRLIKDSKALAYHLVTNRSKIADVKMNAHNIAHLYMTVYQGQLTEAQTTALIPTIDTLVSLYALAYTSPTNKKDLATVLAVENARTDGKNGVRMAMLTQQHAEEMSLSRLFHDSPVLMAKGYIPEIYNPHTDVRAATKEEGETLLNLGYKLVSPLTLDPNDPFREPRNLYVLRNGGMLPWLSGMFSFTNMRAKGTQHHGDNAKGTQAVLARNAGTGRVVAGEGDAFDPTQETTDYMTPTLNPSGVAVNYRYMMHADTKDILLERENRFDEVLGALTGSVFDKEESVVHNKKAVQVLYEDFKEGFTKKSTLYLEVSATSTDPELREIWKMLPQSTKDAVKEIWGKEAMLVRPENLDIAFGYRKLSISSRFSRDVVDQTVIDKAMIGFVSLIMKTYGRTIKGMSPEEADKFAMSNAVTVRRLESMVQEIMHEVKDIYVVKNVITSLNNIKSNLSLLLLYGVNPIKGLRDMRIAWVGAEEHQRDSAALFKLRQQLDTGYITGDTSEIEAEIKRLEEALSNNPVAKVIELGMMPSIVEDVSTEEDPYTYKAALALKMDKYKAKINPKVLTVAKNIAITKDTKVYQSLSRVVQLSDFVGKYALYQHLTTREVEPMKEEAAAHAASEAFINYDVPMHRGLEYMDSVGAFMFTKYFLRVQRVIRGRIKYAPGKLVMLLAAESFLGDLPTIMDASVILRAGNNPLQTGPLELLEALPQLPTLFWLPGR